MTRSCDVYNSETIPIFMNWLGHEGLPFCADLELMMTKKNARAVQISSLYLMQNLNPKNVQCMDCLRIKANECIKSILFS